MSEPGFTPRQVTRITGLPYSTLNHWAKTGLIMPSIDSGKGTGSERIYSSQDLFALKVARELRTADIGPTGIRTVLKRLTGLSRAAIVDIAITESVSVTVKVKGAAAE